MPSTATEIGVWNMALDHLTEHPLTTTSDDNAYARWLTRNVPNLRDAFLRRYTWNFSIQYNELTVDATAPAFRWNYRYECPTDWLRVLPPTNNGTRGDKPIEHEVLGGYILCDVPNTLYVRTIQRVTDYAEWDPLAVDLFSLTLAMRMTMRFVAKATYRDRLQAEMKEVSRLAFSIDAMEGTPDPTEQHDVIDVRTM